MHKNIICSIFVIGDSISIHYGTYLEKIVGSRFSYDRKKGLRNIGTSIDDTDGDNGGDSAKVLKYLTEQNNQNIKYDILLLNCGLHDIKTDIVTQQKQVNIIEYQNNLQAIISLAKKMSSSVMWIRSTPVFDEIHNLINRNFYRYNHDLISYNSLADAIMIKENIPIIDLYEFTKNLGVNITVDHVHYNDCVRKQQAEFIAQYLFKFFNYSWSVII